MDEIDKTRIKQRAVLCWELMDDNEKTAIRIGMTPHWTIKEDLGGKYTGWEKIHDADETRLLCLTLMGFTKEIGGMIV
jgi:hypothetical protein